MTTVTGCWQSWIAEKGQDPKGLGRWSFMRIASRKASLIIITAYRPCTSTGPSTVWMQRWSLLREAGERTPDPIKSFYQDLESTLLDWKNKNYEILLMIDANETVGEKPGGITMILGKVGLIDLTTSKHPHGIPPHTYSRGSKKIDYMFGSIRVKEFCSRAGIAPFGLGYQSDHRALFVILDIKQILQTAVSPIDSASARRLQQATPKERQIFLENTHFHFENQNLYTRLEKLMSSPMTEWTTDQINEYEACDK
jgi:hypothetical protein